MIDDHYYPQNWGIKPVLFEIENFEIPSYSFFVLLGLLVGISIYFYESRRQKSLNERGFFIAIGSLAGGILGAKILQWIIDYKYILSHLSNFEIIFSGRTIVGGLIGGTIGAILTKKILGIKEKRGNLFAPAIAMGVAIGRLGCFFRGCCYGKETFLPWGVNFGDGILRHPTQLYESLFMLIMFFYLEKIKDREDLKPGQLFKMLMISYFIFRFFVEFIRVEPVIFAGLTIFQIISIGVIIYLTRGNIKNLIFKQKTYGKQYK
ncbi:MAG: prolipoprotein diacylglyceryl transferase [Patescibacteria group bacterium]|nr:prolipoprotein diacylglyceryl transferase [Patescibacteria group bacterium]